MKLFPLNPPDIEGVFFPERQNLKIDQPATEDLTSHEFPDENPKESSTVSPTFGRRGIPATDLETDEYRHPLYRIPLLQKSLQSPRTCKPDIARRGIHLNDGTIQRLSCQEIQIALDDRILR